ncbi:PREDICTED: LOW QUALITY PROTEIN: F-box/LRR-repeat MAX2 homolog A-like [Tarenaya hassleriana]|uniref:LOW QUALITY PROTEIN: F-box/LRR-repeat MAX2 homolog A-like n=1 Tax=Tarenaya hassleriana TaxID=28532 RepID=UPI00053C3B62|nr:PREDICTED: LOW QUALITY PROTEIN: F-box/LRR-repeat MAX2 homolog A-like [Tarenaya hassleriana]
MNRETIYNAGLHFNDMPETIISGIFLCIEDTRTRNSMSVVCHKWRVLERFSRSSLTLRGTVRDLFLVPTCFCRVTRLDISLLSPWGYPLFDPTAPPSSSHLLAHLLGKAFPLVVSLTCYARNPFADLRYLAPQWPCLSHVKLVRLHPRPPSLSLGHEFVPLFEHSSSLSSLDLSDFYCWTEDLPQALHVFPSISASLSHLNILTHFSSSGFKSDEVIAITEACPNLNEFLATCSFDRRITGFVGNKALLAVSLNCPLLHVLHLVDISLSNAILGVDRFDDEGYTTQDSLLSNSSLVQVFIHLPLIEDLVLDIGYNVRDVWQALESLGSMCPGLSSLKLGNFHGICRGIDAKPDGIVFCQGLKHLSIKHSADLTDSCLVAIALGCQKLSKFEVRGCNKITETGLSKFMFILKNSLTDVRISKCQNLNFFYSLYALRLIQDRIQRLHLDCIWEIDGQVTEEHAVSVRSRTWAKLQYLSLWIPIGSPLNPWPVLGLNDCPSLEEIHIKVEGDCRHLNKPQPESFGLTCLASYPNLSRLHLDCSGVIGYALTAPPGHTDLNIWERFYLKGIDNLRIETFDYSLPHDPDINHRSLSLPGASLISMCVSMRRLVIHGTVNEHLMMFLLKIPNLRDVQIRQDSYPAPQDDGLSSEMRTASCLRFEDALNRRFVLD